MKVVLFCGGLGLRMSDGSGSIPKPMVTIGNRPILWVSTSRPDAAKSTCS